MDDIQYDKDTVPELNPECRDVLYGCPVIVIRVVCLSYPWHKLGFSWQKLSIDHPSRQDVLVITLKRHQEASLIRKHL